MRPVSTAEELQRRPGDAEFEIALFGRGVGEASLIHVGGNEWWIVDSFSCRNRPIALSYLALLGVPPSQVRHIFISHFDTDHYRGIESLYYSCNGAQFWFSSALNEKWFTRVYSTQLSDTVGELGIVFGLLRDEVRRSRGGRRRMNLLTAFQMGAKSEGVTSFALAPTSDACQSANEELSDVIDGPRFGAGMAPRVRRQLRNQNRCSVVLHLDFHPPGSDRTFAAILGGDLLVSPRRFGWDSVVDDTRISGFQRADLVKVPHHGSESAYSKTLWSDLTTTPEVAILVSPFTSLPSPIPTRSDLKRLGERGAVWLTAPSGADEIDEFGNSLSGYTAAPINDSDSYSSAAGLPPGVGLVRARREPYETAWRVKAWGAAKRQQDNE